MREKLTEAVLRERAEACPTTAKEQRANRMRGMTRKRQDAQRLSSVETDRYACVGG